MEILKLKNIAIGFNTILFENINASLELGSLTALMGINGVGKSCLLKTLANLNPVLRGEISIYERAISSYSAQDLAKIIAVVLTEKPLVDYMTVEELVSLGRSPYTNWRNELTESDKLIVAHSLEVTGLFSLKDSFLSQLSDGQRQKAFIARALAQSPKILILDEPTTYLDIPSKIELVKLLKKIATENQIAVMMSTHDLNLVEENIESIWLLGNGGDFYSGSPKASRALGHFLKYFQC